MQGFRKVEVLHGIQHDGVLYEGGKVYSLDPKTAETFASLRDAVSKEPIARGPAFIRIGSRARYLPSDVLEFVHAKRMQGTGG